MTKKILLAFFATFLSILAIDGLLRMTQIGMYYYNTNAAYSIRRYPHLPKCYRYVANTDMTSGVVGDLSWVSGHHQRTQEVTFKTDSKGFRNSSELSAYDAVILGDSFGVSTLTNQPDILSEQMRSLGYPTYNMSVDAANLWKEVVTFAYEIDKVPLKEGGVVNWMIFEGNDLEGPFFDDLAPEKVANSSIKAFGVRLQNYYKNSVLRNMYKAISAHLKAPKVPEGTPATNGAVVSKDFFGRDMLFNKSYLESLSLTLSEIKSQPFDKDIEKCFLFMSDLCRKKGFVLRCVVIPTKARVYEWVLKNQAPWSSSQEVSTFATYFKAMSESNGTEFMDLGPVLITGSKSEYLKTNSPLFWLNDTHWNDVAQKLVAEKLCSH